MKRIVALILCLVAISSGSANAACRELDVARAWPRPAYAAAPDATVEFFGHNFFQITSSKGTKIITDPVAPAFIRRPARTPRLDRRSRTSQSQLCGDSEKQTGYLARAGQLWRRMEQDQHHGARCVDLHRADLPAAIRQPAQGRGFRFRPGHAVHRPSRRFEPQADRRTDQGLRQSGYRDDSHRRYIYHAADTAREVLQQLKPKIAIPMHYRENTYLLDMFVHATEQIFGDAHDDFQQDGAARRRRRSSCSRPGG